MYQFTIPMAIMDYLPVLFFGVTAVLLLQDLYSSMGKGVYALLSSGSIMVFLAGFCKATWKLLYAANLCDFQPLEQMFLPVNSIGLLFVGISMILLLRLRKKSAVLSAAPVVFTGSLPFITMMVVGLGGLCVGLSILGKKMKKGWVAVLFAASFLLSMGMGYLGTKDSALAWVNWAEQSVNSASQLCLMLGVLVLHRAGLADFDWRKHA